MADFMPSKKNQKKKQIEVVVDEIVIEFSMNQIKEALYEKYKNQLVGPEKLKMPDLSLITIDHVFKNDSIKVEFKWDLVK